YVKGIISLLNLSHQISFALIPLLVPVFHVIAFDAYYISFFKPQLPEPVYGPALFYILVQVSERAHVVEVCGPEYLVQLFAGDGEYSFFFIISGYDFSVIRVLFLRIKIEVKDCICFL